MNRSPLQFTESDFKLALLCVARPAAFGLTGPEIRACQAVIKHFRDGQPMLEEDAAIATRLLEIIERMKRRTADDEEGSLGERQI